MNVTHDSWMALIEGQVRDANKIVKMGGQIASLELRLRKMARQVERLSWQLEFAAFDMNEMSGVSVDAYLDNLAYEERCDNAH